jgi:hypothetical protein
MVVRSAATLGGMCLTALDAERTFAVLACVCRGELAVVFPRTPHCVRKATAGKPVARMRTPSIAGPEAARVSALRDLTRGRRPNGANAVSEVSSAAGLGTEKRRGVRPQAGPFDLSATGLSAVALLPRRSNARTTNVRSGSKADTRHGKSCCDTPLRADTGH